MVPTVPGGAILTPGGACCQGGPRAGLQAVSCNARCARRRRGPPSLSSHARTAITQRLTPSPPFCSVSKVRTLQTKVPYVAIVNIRLEALCRSGVSAGCPVFSGLQTGSCSGPPPAGSALVLWGKHYLNPWVPFFEVEYYRYALRRAPVPPWGVPAVVGQSWPSSIMPALSQALSCRRMSGGACVLAKRAS